MPPAAAHRNLWKRGIPVGLLLVATVFGQSYAEGLRAADQVQLNGAGATFPFPIYSTWIEEFHKVHPEVLLNYQAIGSGGGIKQITEGTVDFGASDGPMTDEQIAAFQTKRGTSILHFPTVLGADVPIYHVSGVTKELRFTPEALAGIFLGKIKKWNDPALTNANPGVNLPADNVVVVHREGNYYHDTQTCGRL